MVINILAARRRDLTCDSGPDFVVIFAVLWSTKKK